MSMLTLFESRYTLKGRYNIGNVGKTASMSMLTLFEPTYESFELLPCVANKNMPNMQSDLLYSYLELYYFQ